MWFLPLSNQKLGGRTCSGAESKQRHHECGRPEGHDAQVPNATAAPGQHVGELQIANAGRTYSNCGRQFGSELQRNLATAAPGPAIRELQQERAGRTLSSQRMERK
jgi:hypothetical protein